MGFIFGVALGVVIGTLLFSAVERRMSADIEELQAQARSIHLPPGFVPNVQCVRENGIVTVRWPDGAIATCISRELLDDMVNRLNERRWMPLPEPPTN